MDTAYAFKNLKEILLQSSSGGAFIGICRSFASFAKETPWSVYGAKFDTEFHVVHSRATTIDECFEFCGSKYVQSDIGKCFKQITNDIKNGYYVLFTGTPCQIAAVNTFIVKNGYNNERLYTVDIVCHGTPQPQFWQDYVKYLEKRNQSRLTRFSFRYKKKGWKGYPILAEFENGKRYENAFDVSIYMNLFRKNLLMRRGCFNCKYPGNFQSNITIADFWGVELCMPDVPVEGGVSLMLAHTKKGRDLINGMQSEGTLLKPVPSEDYLKYNHNLRHKTLQPDDYDLFWSDYKNNGIEYVLRKYGENNLKGRWKFNLRRFLRDSGVLAFAKRALRKA